MRLSQQLWRTVDAEGKAARKVLAKIYLLYSII